MRSIQTFKVKRLRGRYACKFKQVSVVL